MVVMKQTFSAVMAYENANTAKRAKEMWDRLMRALKDDYRLKLRLWKFDVLRIPEVRDAAATDVARANITLIATRGAGELPAEVKAWIELWLAQKRNAQDNKRALAVLFDAPPDKLGASALAQFAYLQRVARQGNMDFFVSTLDQPGEAMGFSRLQIAERPRAAMSRGLITKEGQHL
jgi:hypothetical protein